MRLIRSNRVESGPREAAKTINSRGWIGIEAYTGRSLAEDSERQGARLEAVSAVVQAAARG